jgi:hypothetical protein
MFGVDNELTVKELEENHQILIKQESDSTMQVCVRMVLTR